jgi:hypothetical protein
MSEILIKHLDIENDSMDELIEHTEYFFGTEEL